MTGYQSKKMMAQSRDPEPDDLVKRLRHEQSLLRPESNWRQLTEEAADCIEQLDEKLAKSQQRANELWQTLVEIHHVVDGKEPNMDGRLWPLFITVVRDRIEALEAALEIADRRISYLEGMRDKIGRAADGTMDLQQTRIKRLEKALRAINARLSDDDSWLAQSIEARQIAESALVEKKDG